MKTKKKNEFQLDDNDCALICEALKEKLKKVEEERYYRNQHPEGFYRIYIEKYSKLINWFSGKPIPILKDYKFKI